MLKATVANLTEKTALRAALLFFQTYLWNPTAPIYSHYILWKKNNKCNNNRLTTYSGNAELPIKKVFNKTNAIKMVKSTCSFLSLWLFISTHIQKWSDVLSTITIHSFFMPHTCTLGPPIRLDSHVQLWCRFKAKPAIDPKGGKTDTSLFCFHCWFLQYQLW